MFSKKYYVYVLCYPDGMPFYVGRGTGTRINDHEKEASFSYCYGNKHKVSIIKKIKASGDKILKNILYHTDSFEESCIKEIELIQKYGRRDKQTGILANLTDGGDGTKNVSDWHKSQIIASNKSRIISQETKDKIRASMLGNIRSEESKRKTSETLKISCATIENKKRISDRFLGKKKTPEQCKNISKGLTGRKFSDIHRKNMSDSQKGRPSPKKGCHLTEETKKKISESSKGLRMKDKNPFYGKHHTEETKKKIGFANKEIKRQKREIKDLARSFLGVI